MPLPHFLFTLILGLSLPTYAQTINLQLGQLHEFKLPTPVTAENKTFGTALSIAGSTAAIAAIALEAQNSGTVYLYANHADWHLLTALNSGQQRDNFAKHIQLLENRLIVSADRDSSHGTDSGAVYIYDRINSSNITLWQQTAKLTAPDAQAGDRFGSSIALVDDTLYIGAPGSGQGKVYLYARNPSTGLWHTTTTIEPEDSQAKRFGESIAKNGQTLVIGAPQTDADNSTIPKNKKTYNFQTPISRFQISKGDTFDPGIASGAVFVYEYINDVWQPTARLGSPDRESNDNLGEQVAIEGNTIIASTKHKDVRDDLRAGAVYVYQKVANTWQEEVALVAPDNNVGATFGNSIAILDQHILIGANKIHKNGFNSGSAYLFARDTQNHTWTNILQLSNSTLQAHDQFGLSVALGTDQILVASKKAVYAFQNTAINPPAAIFYPDDNILQLNTVTTTDIGNIGLTLLLTQQTPSLTFTLIDGYFHTNSQQAHSSLFTADTGQLSIPQLTLYDIASKSYKVDLQIIEQSNPLQFQLKSIMENEF